MHEEEFSDSENHFLYSEARKTFLISDEEATEGGREFSVTPKIIVGLAPHDHQHSSHIPANFFELVP